MDQELNFFCNKKILITGHTGFKGSWLTAWLLELGSKVIGISKDIPTKPSLFEVLNLESRIRHYQFNLVDTQKLKKVINSEKPDFIFHLAAQAIVSVSYNDSLETIESNVMGTASLLESIKPVEWNLNCVFITSDKSYLNVEWPWGYKETDALGGFDIYSGSKAAAEQIIHSYYHSFFKEKKNINLAIGRAGNVIGGGDWAKDRIVVDTMKAWSNGKKVTIRNPNSTRPWQHVLEPLSGYLNLAAKLSENKFDGEAFNFGPSNTRTNTVKDLIKDLSHQWFKNNSDSFIVENQNTSFDEAKLLKLNCDKALYHLKWHSTLNYDQTHQYVSSWYYEYYHGKSNIIDFTLQQIKDFTEIANKKKLEWARN